MHVVDAEERVWTLHREYCSALRKASYADLQVAKLHLSIAHISKKLKPQQLHKWMMDIIAWKRDENFQKENFGRFMREIAVQAEEMQVEQRTIHGQSERIGKTLTCSHKPARKHRHVVKKSTRTKESTQGRIFEGVNTRQFATIREASFSKKDSRNMRLHRCSRGILGRNSYTNKEGAVKTKSEQAGTLTDGVFGRKFRGAQRNWTPYENEAHRTVQIF